MALVMCPLCMEQEDVEVLGVLPDGRQKARCRPCRYPFDYGEALRRLPTADMVSSEDLGRAERLKALFLAREHTGLDPRVPTTALPKRMANGSFTGRYECLGPNPIQPSCGKR